MEETVKGIIDQLPGAFQPSAASGMDAVYQYEITGDQASNYHLIVKDGALTINEGVHPAPSCKLIMDTPDFIDLMSGRLDGMTAFMTGKLKVEGDLMQAQRLAGLFKV